jgi:hypothetical protein
MNNRWFVAGAVLCGLGCGEGMHIDACDIRKASCQQDVFLAVQYVRGTAWDPWLEAPPMRVINEAQYLAHLRPASGEPAPDYFTPALKQLAMLDPDEQPDAAASFDVSTIQAYYDGLSDSVTIVDHGKAIDLRDDTLTLAHELVHAAQHRDVAPGDWVYPETTDEDAALTTVLEGEAELYANLVSLLMNDKSPHDVDWTRYHTQRVAGTRSEILDSKSPYRVATSFLPYVLGSRYMTARWLDAGPLGVRRALAARPDSTEAFMLEPRAAAHAHTAAARCARPEAASGYERQVSTSIGGWGVYSFATRMVDDPAAWSFGTNWRSDRIDVFADDDDAVALVWRIQLDSEESAQAFEAALPSLPDTTHITSKQEGDSVTLFTADTVEPSDWPEWMACSERG